MSAPPTTMPVPASAADPVRSRTPGRAGLPDSYRRWLAARGRGNRCFAEGAASFLARWPAPQACATERLEVQLGIGANVRPFVTFLLLHDLLRPGYDYLVHRKFASLVDLCRGTRLQADLDGFQHAARELGFSTHVGSR